MNHNDHLSLLRPGVPGDTAGATWADLGAGSGAFTMALAELLGPGATLYAVDRDPQALARNKSEMARRYPKVRLETLMADFTMPLGLPPVDGIIMANSLHFVRDKVPLLRRVRGYLQPGGRLIVVEYNVNRGNHWVPYPVAYDAYAELARQAGYYRVSLLARAPSRFLGEFYAALALPSPL